MDNLHNYSAPLSDSVSTPQLSVSSFPFSEGFESGEIPSAWSHLTAQHLMRVTLNNDATTLGALPGGIYVFEIQSTSGKITKKIAVR